MTAEQRRRPRVEPPDVTATVPVGHLKIEGSVLDISRWGLAISIPPGLKLPKERAAVSLD